MRQVEPRDDGRRRRMFTLFGDEVVGIVRVGQHYFTVDGYSGVWTFEFLLIEKGK